MKPYVKWLYQTLKYHGSDAPKPVKKAYNKLYKTCTRIRRIVTCKKVDIDIILNFITSTDEFREVLVRSFGEFIYGLEHSKLNLKDNSYRDYIRNHVRCRGLYRYSDGLILKDRNGNIDEKEITKALIADIKLYRSIKRNGLRVPIALILNKNRQQHIVIDGHHRLIILEVLGFDKVNYTISYKQDSKQIRKILRLERAKKKAQKFGRKSLVP